MFEKKAQEGNPDDDYNLELYFRDMNTGEYRDAFNGYIDNKGVDFTNRRGIKINLGSLLKIRYNVENRKGSSLKRDNKKRVNLEQYHLE